MTHAPPVIHNNDEQTDALELAVHQFLAALEHPQARRTAPRVAELWRGTILAGQQTNLAAVPRLLACQDGEAADPVAVRGIAIHLVCPHHLTIAFGRAELIYIPKTSIASLGSLSQLCTAATARLVLQEQATAAIVDALTDTDGLAARAATARIVAHHPCQRLGTPAAHAAEILSIASRGEPHLQARLEALLT